MATELRFFQPDLSAQDLMFSQDFSPHEFAERRCRIAEKIGADAHLLIPSAPPMPGDVRIQDANFYYFAGLEVCRAFLFVKGGSGHTTLFLPSREGPVGDCNSGLGFEDAELFRSRAHLDEVMALSALNAALSEVKILYLPHTELEGGGVTRAAANLCARLRAEEPWDQVEPRHQRLVRQLRERIPDVEIRDACPLINTLRAVKSSAEIALLRQAGTLAAAALMAAMKATRPGITENRLQAVAEYVFRDRGHCAPGYGVIVAGGKRTWDGHYHLNNATLRNDEIVLMDCGPDLRHYTADVARIWPVRGIFSAWHRRVYGFIVEYHRALLQEVRPGRRPEEIYAHAAGRMRARCDGPNAPWPDLRPILEQIIQRGVHYLNHAVGMSVHDAVAPWRDDPLREGMVCALDPMVWCEDRHEYIRVEDTIAVTAEGCERLTGDAPLDPDEIEHWMASR